MPCSLDVIHNGEKVNLQLGQGSVCNECETEIIPPDGQVVATYIGFNEKGWHVMITDSIMTCPKCGGSSKELGFECGNSARSLFSQANDLEPKASTEAEQALSEVVYIQRPSDEPPTDHYAPLSSLWQ